MKKINGATATTCILASYHKQILHGYVTKKEMEMSNSEKKKTITLIWRPLAYDDRTWSFCQRRFIILN